MSMKLQMVATTPSSHIGKYILKVFSNTNILSCHSVLLVGYHLDKTLVNICSWVWGVNSIE
jgi:hypothetical protein